MIANRIRTIGFLSLFTLCMIPTHVKAGENPNQHGYQLTATQKRIVIASIAVILFVCSEDAQATVTKATIHSALICLRLLQKLPSSDTIKQKIQAKIDYLETVYTTRASNGPKQDPTQVPAPLKILKILKEVIDALKAAEWALG